MAHHEEQSPGITHDIGLTPVTAWLAGLAGTGMTLMIVAAGIGVITGQGVGLLFGLGTIMLVTGIIAYVAVERPFEHFDDINQPIDGSGHAHADETEDHADDSHSAPAHH
jgi:hypothetical protein